MPYQEMPCTQLGTFSALLLSRGLASIITTGAVLDHYYLKWECFQWKFTVIEARSVEEMASPSIVLQLIAGAEFSGMLICVRIVKSLHTCTDVAFADLGILEETGQQADPKLSALGRGMKHTPHNLITVIPCLIVQLQLAGG
ncbi:UNVERIFIED_CONTAM: hypothetical protein K2H54_037278 [Gekko kuhli]